MDTVQAGACRSKEMDSMNAPKVVVEGLCKVFGSHPQQALDMLARGAPGNDEFC